MTGTGVEEVITPAGFSGSARAINGSIDMFNDVPLPPPVRLLEHADG